MQENNTRESPCAWEDKFTLQISYIYSIDPSMQATGKSRN